MAKSKPKTIYGYIEYVVLVDNSLIIEAKLDTGAKSASLNAINIKRKKISGQVFVEFDVPSQNGLVHFRSPFLGYVAIKPRVNEFSFSALKKLISIKRPLVQLPMQLGGVTKTIKVNLTNRKHFNYPLLLGRDAIVQFRGIVDPDIQNSIPKPSFATSYPEIMPKLQNSNTRESNK